MSLDHSDEGSKSNLGDSDQQLSEEPKGKENNTSSVESSIDIGNKLTQNKELSSDEINASEKEKIDISLEEVKKEEETSSNNEESSDKSKDNSESCDSIDVNKNTDSENEEDLTYVCKESSRSDKDKKCSDEDDNDKAVRPESIHSEIQMLQNKIDAIRARQATLKQETQFLVKQFDELLEHYRQMGGEVLDLSDISI